MPDLITDQRKEETGERGLSVQLLMVLIAVLDGRLLTLFSLDLGSIVTRLTR